MSFYCHPTVGYIAGGVVAALLVLSVVASVLMYYFGQRKKRKTRELDFTCCVAVTVSDFELLSQKCTQLFLLYSYTQPITR